MRMSFDGCVRMSGGSPEGETVAMLEGLAWSAVPFFGVEFLKIPFTGTDVLARQKRCPALQDAEKAWKTHDKMTDLCGEFGDPELYFRHWKSEHLKPYSEGIRFWLMKFPASTFQVYWKPGD